MLEAGADISFANCGLPYFIGGDIKSRSKLILQSPETLDDKICQLIEAAHAGGGRDNIAVVLLQASVPDPAARRGLLFRMLGK